MVRFGYDGSGFSGWARQPHARTVEGLLRAALTRRGIVASLDTARLEVASRTDRGVSARGNALALWSELSGVALLRRLNTIAPELFFTAFAPVPVEFRVRSASCRTYRYFEPERPSDLSRFEGAARLFRGRIDVRSFGRAIGADAPLWRSIESVAVSRDGPGLSIEVQAPSFVWGMVRKIVGSLREVDAGRLSVDRLGQAIEGRERLTLPMAEPEGLVLWDVEYPIAWEGTWPGPTRHQRRDALAARDALWRRQRVLDSLWSEARSPEPESRGGIRAPPRRRSGPSGS